MKRFFALAALLACPGLASAHQAGLSRGEVVVHGDQVDVALRIPAAELAAAFPEEAAPPLPGGGLVGALLGQVEVSQGGESCLRTAGAGSAEPPDGATFTSAYRCPRPAAAVELRLAFLGRMPPGHVHLARVRGGGGERDEVVDARHDHLAIEPAVPSRPERAAGLVVLGVEHILSGWDHLAFLLGLLLAGGRLRDVIRTVTAFTAGHALTLALATVGVVSPPSAIVEPLIAASVVLVAARNLLDVRRKVTAGPRWPIALGFGLVHGLGFAGALAELALPRARLAESLFSFNLGVELGQAAIVAVVFPLLVLLRRRPALARAGLPAGSLAVGGAGLLWLVQRLPGGAP